MPQSIAERPSENVVKQQFRQLHLARSARRHEQLLRLSAPPYGSLLSACSMRHGNCLGCDFRRAAISSNLFIEIKIRRGNTRNKPRPTTERQVLNCPLQDVGFTLLFAAPSDRTGLRLLNLMDGREAALILSRDLEQSQPKISHHLAYLRRAGVVAPQCEGK